MEKALQIILFTIMIPIFTTIDVVMFVIRYILKEWNSYQSFVNDDDDYRYERE